MTTQILETIRDNIANIPGVVSASIWGKHNKSRIYIELPKLNGGKNWNGGRAGTVYYDADENKISYRSDWAGAKTRDRALEIIEAIESRLGI